AGAAGVLVIETGIVFFVERHDRGSCYCAAAESLSAVFVSTSLASCRSCSCSEGSPAVRLTIRPRFTAGRACIWSVQRCTFLYSCTPRNSPPPYELNFTSPPYHGQIAISAIVFSGPATYSLSASRLSSTSRRRFVSIAKRSIAYSILTGA